MTMLLDTLLDKNVHLKYVEQGANSDVIVGEEILESEPEVPELEMM